MPATYVYDRQFILSLRHYGVSNLKPEELLKFPEICRMHTRTGACLPKWSSARPSCSLIPAGAEGKRCSMRTQALVSQYGYRAQSSQAQLIVDGSGGNDPPLLTTTGGVNPCGLLAQQENVRSLGDNTSPESNASAHTETQCNQARSPGSRGADATHGVVAVHNGNHGQRKIFGVVCACMQNADAVDSTAVHSQECYRKVIMHCVKHLDINDQDMDDIVGKICDVKQNGRVHISSKDKSSIGSDVGVCETTSSSVLCAVREAVSAVTATSVHTTAHKLLHIGINTESVLYDTLLIIYRRALSCKSSDDTDVLVRLLQELSPLQVSGDGVDHTVKRMMSRLLHKELSYRVSPADRRKHKKCFRHTCQQEVSECRLCYVPVTTGYTLPLVHLLCAGYAAHLVPTHLMCWSIDHVLVPARSAAAANDIDSAADTDIKDVDVGSSSDDSDIMTGYTNIRAGRTVDNDIRTRDGDIKAQLKAVIMITRLAHQIHRLPHTYALKMEECIGCVLKSALLPIQHVLPVYNLLVTVTKVISYHDEAAKSMLECGSEYRHLFDGDVNISDSDDDISDSDDDISDSDNDISDSNANDKTEGIDQQKIEIIL